MSCDTNYTFIVSSIRKKKLLELKKYLKEKKERWDWWDSQGKGAKELLSLTIEKDYPDVVSWGFTWEPIIKHDGYYSMKGFSWANENTMNMHLRGEEGELANITKRFPDIEWDVEYYNEYGEEGSLCPPFFE